MKAALVEISPEGLVVTRFGIAAVFLALLTLATGHRLSVRRAHWGGVLLLGFLGVFLHHLLQANALRYTSAGAAGWLVAIIPVFTAILAAVILRERLSVTAVLGLLIALGGTLLVVSRGHLSSLSSGPGVVGDVLMVASAVNWAVYSVLLRRLALPYHVGVVTLHTCWLGMLMMVPLAVGLGGWRQWVGLSGTTWAHLAFLGIGPSALGYLGWAKALEGLEATRAAVFQYLQPLVTVAGAVIVLHEPVSWPVLVGGAIILAGISLVDRRATTPKATGAAGPGIADV